MPKSKWMLFKEIAVHIEMLMFPLVKKSPTKESLVTVLRLKKTLNQTQSPASPSKKPKQTPEHQYCR